jgi:adenosylmethionine-8-amino-7-oxononanoate aminotransferase
VTSDLTAPAGLLDIWLPVTQMAEFRRNPLIVQGGEGIYLRSSDGRMLLDGVSAAMVTSLGYSNERVRGAMVEQLGRLPFGPVLHGTSEPALELAARLTSILPGDLGRAFLVSGGSEATETALKMARQYHGLGGQPGKTKVIGRHGAYHGATKGALSVSGLRDRSLFTPLVPDVVRVTAPDSYRSSSAAEESVRAIERTIALEGRDTVAAVIVDPVMAAAGIVVPPRDHYRALREVCGEDILLIFDEVLTGFGRTGHWFAADHYGVVPDIVCLGKGMSAGYAPLSAAVARPEIAERFDDSGATFQHIHTFGGHPVAAAAGLAVIDELQERGLVEHAQSMGARLMDGLSALADRCPAIGDVRGLGLLAGIELVSDRELRTRFATPMAPRVVEHALEHEDLLIRCSRDVVQLAPPLISTPAEIDEILSRLERALQATLGAG